MAIKRAVVTKVALPAVAAGALIAVGIASTGSSDPSKSRDTAAETAPVANAQVGDPADPATWKLPIEAYVPSRSDRVTVSAERDKLMDRCVDQAGYPDWQPAPDLPVVGGETLVDWRYGIHDAAAAEKWGYHPDPTKQKARDAALAAGAVDPSKTPSDVVNACFEETEKKIPTFPATTVAGQVGADAWKKAKATPKVVKAFSDWSGCMKAKGFTYAKPMDANDDPKFAVPEISDLEIKTATADIECRNKHNVARSWFDAESALQQAEIEKNKERLDTLRIEVADVTSKAMSLRKNS